MCVGVWRAGREGLGEHEHNFRQAHESWVLRLGNSQLVLVGGGRIAEVVPAVRRHRRIHRASLDRAQIDPPFPSKLINRQNIIMSI